MRQYIKYLKLKIIVTGVIALVFIIMFANLLNLENTLGFSLLIIGSIVTIGYTYLRYNYYRKINKLDKEVLESLK
jgi:O-antigen/teichoic acid export membrane protein